MTAKQVIEQTRALIALFADNIASSTQDNARLLAEFQTLLQEPYTIDEEQWQSLFYLLHLQQEIANITNTALKTLMLIAKVEQDFWGLRAEDMKDHAAIKQQRTLLKQQAQTRLQQQKQQMKTEKWQAFLQKLEWLEMEEV